MTESSLPRSAVIATLTGHQNYGNRLQNFALQIAIEQAGYSIVRTLKGRHRDDVSTAQNFGLIGRGRIALRKLRAESESLAHWHGPTRAVRSVEAALRRFDNEFINFVDPNETPEMSATATYSRYVIGSDQVWNPRFGLVPALAFGESVLPSRRIAYAASFGVDSIPDQLREEYVSGIGGLAHISVREHKAAELVFELVGRRAEVVLDPTMLIEESVWKDLAKQAPGYLGSPYCLGFLLTDRSKVQASSLEALAQSRGLQLRWFPGRREADAYYGIQSFLANIRDAKLVVTDSFHATVFALLFEVPVVTLQRGSMFSRIETLRHLLSLPSQEHGLAEAAEVALQTDWRAVSRSLRTQRDFSRQVLKESLD